MTTTTTRYGIVTVHGNYRYLDTCEWAGTGRVGAAGDITCAADLGDDVYDAIESAIAAGETEGRVNAADEGRYYEWEYVAD